VVVCHHRTIPHLLRIPPHRLTIRSLTGAVGIEVSAEIKNNHPHLDVTLVHSRAELLSNDPLPADFKARALSCLREEGVNVILSTRATVAKAAAGTTRVALADGRELTAGKVIQAIQKPVPVTDALPAEAVDGEGYVKVFPK
jgi:apoptosis-inducing factor 2